MVVSVRLSVVALNFMSLILIDKLAKINLMKEVTENKNIGAAIVVAALLLGLAQIIGQM